MPELADAEKAADKLKEVSKGATITKVDLPSGDDHIVFDGVDGQTFTKAIQGKKVVDVGRKGKYFYMMLESAPHVLFHFGMTGTSQVRGKVEAAYYRGSSATKRNAEPESEWPPKHCKLVISFTRPRSSPASGNVSASPYFASGSRGAGKVDEESVTEEWAFSDARRFGRIVLKPDHPLNCEPLISMGRDPLTDMPTLDDVRDLILKRKAPIKAVLMDQRGPVCGLGNWMVDEVLFQSHIHPDHPSPMLEESHLSTLIEKIRYVSVEAVRAEGKEERFPAGWLFSRRWGKGKGGNEVVMADGSTRTIEWITVGGRTTAIVPSLQVMPEGVERKTPKKRKGREMDEVDADSEDGVFDENPPSSRKKTSKSELKTPRSDGLATPTRTRRAALKKDSTTPASSPATHTSPSVLPQAAGTSPSRTRRRSSRKTSE